jgi:hypothetical protein
MHITYTMAGAGEAEGVTLHATRTGRDAVDVLRAIENTAGLTLTRVQLRPDDNPDAWALNEVLWAAQAAGCPVRRQWVRTRDVRMGDELAHKLSDTPWTYTPVTGWADRLLELSRFGGGLADVTHRTFRVSAAPWWVRDDNMMLTCDLDGEALIRLRPIREPGRFRCPCCGDDVISADGRDWVCGDCAGAGCEQSRDACGELNWWNCQRDDEDGA